jgi:hypothetical protein
MEPRTNLILIAVVLALVVVAGIAAWFYSRQRRSKMLRDRFGPEYDRVVKREGDVRRGEGILEFRQQKRDHLQIRPLPAPARTEFSKRWNAVQAQFVDDPQGSAADADRLVREIMEARGYPVANLEELDEIISVDHPRVVENYREAHDLATGRTRSQSTTEGLRKAMVHYRSLFDELLQDTSIERKEARA